MELTEAHMNLSDIITEYEQYEMFVVQDEEYSDSEY